MKPHASAPSAAPALRSAVINLSSPTMSPGPALALSVVNAVEVEWAAAFDMVRVAFLAGKCPEYSVH
jgi:hypothetical protein